MHSQLELDASCVPMIRSTFHTAVFTSEAPTIYFPMAEKNKSKEEDEKSIKIQETFLKERKVFLWGEVSDKSARDVTE